MRVLTPAKNDLDLWPLDIKFAPQLLLSSADSTDGQTDVRTDGQAALNATDRMTEIDKPTNIAIH